MKKRFLLKVCCGILALAMLAGCGNSSSSSSGQSSFSTVLTSSAESTPESSETNGTEEKLPLTEQTLPVSDEKVTLSYWRVWSNDYTPDFNEYQVNKEMEELTNVKIEFTTVASSIGKEKFGILLASQDLPDMIENNVAYPGGGEKAISDGIYIDMAPYVADYMPTYRALRESDETVRKMTVSDTGKMWGIYPLFCNNDMELCAEPSWIGMVIRQDWLDGLKLEQPHTIDQWHTVLTAFKEQKGAEAPLLLSKTGIMPYDYFLSAFGVKSEFYRDGSTVKYGPIEEGYRQYLELMAQWYEEGLVDQNFISNEITSNAPKDYIATGKSGVATYSWAGTGNYLYETGSSTDANINWQPITGPVLKEGEVCQARNISYIAIQTPVSVTSSCEYPEVAAKWLDYQYTKDGFIANSFGDSECYTVDGEGNYAFTDKIMNGEHGIDPQNEQFCYRRKDFPGLVSWKVYDLTNPAQRLAAREVYDSDGTDLVLPKIEMTDTEGNEYNALYTDIQTFVQEKTATYIMGSESLDSFDSFVETIKGMNIDRCIEIQQAALERYDAR